MLIMHRAIKALLRVCHRRLIHLIFCFRRVLLQLPESIEASFRLLMVLSQTTDEPMQRQLAAVLERAIEGHADDLELAPGITPSMIRQVLKKVASTTL